jgi:hypothetical protein
MICPFPAAEMIRIGDNLCDRCFPPVSEIIAIAEIKNI